MRYIGGKNQAGVLPRLINQIPPHRVYVEAFLGSGAVLRRKRPAEQSIGLDLVPDLFPVLQDAAPNLTLLQDDALRWLRRHRWRGDEFVYLDPPYLVGERASPRRYYRAEFSDAQHEELLALVLRLPCKVMISGYPSELYDRKLAGWRRLEFTSYTRTHRPRTEVLWMNYPEPDELHDISCVGRDYRDRWRLKKLVRRWRARIARMKPVERQILADVLLSIDQRRIGRG